MIASSRRWVSTLAGLTVLMALTGTPVVAQDAEPINPPPTLGSWTALAKLPDWSGIWAPDTIDQVKQEKTNEPSWTGKVAEQIAFMRSEEKADRVQEDFMTGVRSGVNGTPTFFINGVRYDGSWDFTDLVSAIEASLRGIAVGSAAGR